MKATPYIQAIEDCIVLLDEIALIPDTYLNVLSQDTKENVESMLERLDDLKDEYYFQKDNKIDLEKK